MSDYTQNLMQLGKTAAQPTGQAQTTNASTRQQAQPHVGGGGVGGWLDAYGQNKQQSWGDYFDSYRKAFQKDQPAGFEGGGYANVMGQNQSGGSKPQYQFMLNQQQRQFEDMLNSRNQEWQSKYDSIGQQMQQQAAQFQNWQNAYSQQLQDREKYYVDAFNQSQSAAQQQMQQQVQAQEELRKYLADMEAQNRNLQTSQSPAPLPNTGNAPPITGGNPTMNPIDAGQMPGHNNANLPPVGQQPAPLGPGSGLPPGMEARPDFNNPKQFTGNDEYKAAYDAHVKYLESMAQKSMSGQGQPSAGGTPYEYFKSLYGDAVNNFRGGGPVSNASFKAALGGDLTRSRAQIYEPMLPEIMRLVQGVERQYGTDVVRKLNPGILAGLLEQSQNPKSYWHGKDVFGAWLNYHRRQLERAGVWNPDTNWKDWGVW